MLKVFAIFLAGAILSGCHGNANLQKQSANEFADKNAGEQEQLRRIASDDEETLDTETDDFVTSLDANTSERIRVSRGALWDYDAGPDLSNPVGRRYAELFALTPNYRGIGQVLLSEGRNDRRDKFRWQFGPMFYRGRLGANQVKVLIIGQEGAQDENISDRSFTGGTGGRMQNMLAYMGLDKSYLFLNTFLYTIQGQYADFAPMLIDGQLRWRNFLTPGMLNLSQDPRSPIVAHRHAILDHAIAANIDSLKLIIAVGGAAQDSLATYIMSKGGNCLPSVEDAQRVQAVAYGSVSAGGNKKFFFPVDRDGRNLLVGAQEKLDFSSIYVQDQLKQRAQNPEVMKRLVRLQNGPLKNGLMDLRQTTMRLETCKVQGRNNTLFGLGGLGRDIRFIGLQHPGSNSPTLQAKFAAALKQIHSWQSGPWHIDPDTIGNGRMYAQPFERGFQYANIPVPRRDFRFGLPEVVGLGKTSTTRREFGVAIEIGSRNAGQYQQPSDAYQPNQQYQRTDLPNEPPKSQFQLFDPGPGEKWARILTEGLPVQQLTAANQTAAASFGAGAIYRGRPQGAEVFILADQASHDDMWVGRALVGLEGQRLQAFLSGIGVGPEYFILRTLPVDTMGGNPRNIQQLLEISRQWRNQVMQKFFAENRETLRVIFVMGPQAEQEIRAVQTGNIPVISLSGPQGYRAAFRRLTEIFQNRARPMALKLDPIPIAREDIPYGMRRWTGTAGDRVQRAAGAQSGQLYRIVVPFWAFKGPAAEVRPLSQQEAAAVRVLR